VCRFLLISLNIDAILGEVTISARREKLKEMTKGNHLGDGYETTLARMGAQKGGGSRLGMEALMWVSNAERPLHASELCHALGVKKESTDMDRENIPEIRTILGCSLGLITVEAYSSTVRLVHFTLHEYLSNNPRLFQSPHTMIAEVCLTYLNFQCVQELPPALSSAPQTFPLVEYASCYWEEHIRREKTERVSPLALQLLLGFEHHISSKLLLLHYRKNLYRWDWDFKMPSLNGPTGLHGAALLGNVEIVAALLATKEWDINAIDTVGRTALVWATIRGYEDVARMLLQSKDANPNIADVQCGQTPLSWAAKGGHEGVIKLLLEREDINPNTTDISYGRTPLGWAAGGGHERIVKLLLERKDIDPNAGDTERGRTALSCAAEGGIVKFLLELEDINPYTADFRYGRTPLWRAAKGSVPNRPGRPGFGQAGPGLSKFSRI